MKRRKWLDAAVLVVILLATIAPLTVHAHPAAEEFVVSNFLNGDTVRYDLPLLTGIASASHSVAIKSYDATRTWEVHDGRWRAFVPLTAGTNDLVLTTSAGNRYRFSLVYQPQSNPRAVRMVYPMGQDSTGDFDAPASKPAEIGNAERRLQLAGRVLQSLTAELLVERGYPRRTFRLLTDGDDNPLVSVTRSPHSVAELRNMEGVELWMHYLELFRGIPNRNDTIDIAVMADTHYDAASGTLEGHTALGGGPLALFGGATLYSYPETVEELALRLQDISSIEPYLFPEYGRRPHYWATYATSVGAILHELGHCFGLKHPENATAGDIMWRGFDFLNRTMSTYEPGFGSIDPTVDVMPRWTDEDVAILSGNGWLDSGDMGGGQGGPSSVPLRVQLNIDHFTFLAEAGAKRTFRQPVPVNLTWDDGTWTAGVKNGDLHSLSIDKPTGNSGQAFVISLDSAGYAPGEYRGSVEISPTGNGPTRQVSVTLLVVDRLHWSYCPLLLQ